MKSFTDGKVIVPWDFSELSKIALAKTVDLVDSPDQVELIHVTPYPAASEPAVVWGMYSEVDISDSLLKSYREEVDPKFAKLRFTTVFGDPGTEIAHFAERHDAGLIVISSHGRRGLPRMLLGSVAERVVRLAPCPVLVLRTKEDKKA